MTFSSGIRGNCGLSVTRLKDFDNDRDTEQAECNANYKEPNIANCASDKTAKGGCTARANGGN